MRTTAPCDCPAVVTIPYTIVKATPHSGRYFPDNILVDLPGDPSSRWSGISAGNANQWILLRLETLSVLESITFGKYSKPHPCNMKEFKVLIGLDEEHMIQVLHAGLKNDAVLETFQLRHENSDGVVFPTRYVKIVPMCAHAQSFHTSVWYVTMTGITNTEHVEQVRWNHEQYRETMVMKYILKHLRQRCLISPYRAIMARTQLSFEHPYITELYENIAIRGDWFAAEQSLHTLCDAGMFASFVAASQPHAELTRLRGTDANGDVPSARGGHSTCIDPENEIMYLFGGWNGMQSLDDFWEYNIREDRWRCLSHSMAGQQNAPGPRSCHKMVFDTMTGSIYLLGRLDDDALQPSVSSAASAAATGGSHRASMPSGVARGDQGAPQAKTYCSEFFRYHTRGTDAGKWDCLSFDTASSGGPPLVFDHQMVMDCEAQIIYVFGGRVVDGDSESFKYSGLYSYNVRLSKWKLLQNTDATGDSTQVDIPPRFGQSMVLEPNTKTLYIFAGQRDDKYLSDMYSYDVNTNTSTELFSDFTSAGGPDACFTQRAVINPSSKEIYVFCGLTRQSSTVGSQSMLRSCHSNWIYRYDSKPGKWTQILLDLVRSPEQPVPRFAHQVVFNTKTGAVYLHGGNSGGLSTLEHLSGSADVGSDAGVRGEGKDGTGKEKRLDDFWRMDLRRPSREEIVRRATFRLRRQHFRELCEDAPPVHALHFLQSSVSSVVDPTNPAEEASFRELLSNLLHPLSVPTPALARAIVHCKGPADGRSRTELCAGRRSVLPRKRSHLDATDGDGDSWINRLSESEGDVQSDRDAGMTSLADGDGESAPRTARIDLEDSTRVLSEDRARRYAQRMEVFESLLEFVGKGAKEPEGELLDLVDQSGEWRMVAKV